MLAVSEAQRGYILRLTLPDLEPAGFVRCGVSPGRLAACGVTLFAGLRYALCAEGESDLRTIVGYIDERGAFHPQIALPGLPGAMAACGGGLLVGHLGNLTMLDAPNCRIRWQTKTRGLPTQLVPFNRFAVFADETDGLVGLIDLRRGRIYRRAQCDCPAGLAVI